MLCSTSQPHQSSVISECMSWTQCGCDWGERRVPWPSVGWHRILWGIIMCKRRRESEETDTQILETVNSIRTLKDKNNIWQPSVGCLALSTERERHPNVCILMWASVQAGRGWSEHLFPPPLLSHTHHYQVLIRDIPPWLLLRLLTVV